MRLIDADALPKYTGYALSAVEVAKAVENAPTIDAVQVVKCKNCRYRYFEGGRNEKTYCTEHPNFGNLPADWFCPDGMKREEQE